MWTMRFWCSISRRACCRYPARPKTSPIALRRVPMPPFRARRPVHRLDKDTSGLIVFARTAEALAHIGLQFEKRRTGKAYQALVWGQPEADSGRVDQPLIADWPNRPKQHISTEHGRPAQTEWQVIDGSPPVRVSLHPLYGAHTSAARPHGLPGPSHSRRQSLCPCRGAERVGTALSACLHAELHPSLERDGIAVHQRNAVLGTTQQQAAVVAARASDPKVGTGLRSQSMRPQRDRAVKRVHLGARRSREPAARCAG